MKQTILKYSSLLALLGSTFFSTQTFAAECATGTVPATGCRIDVSDITYTLTGDITSGAAQGAGILFDSDSAIINYTGSISVEAMGVGFDIGADNNTMNMTGNINIAAGSNTRRGVIFNQGENNTLNLTGNILTANEDGYGVIYSGGSVNTGAVEGNITTTGDTGHGIAFDNSNLNNYTQTGNIATSGNAAHGIYLLNISTDETGSDSNTINMTGNITTTGDNSYGIYSYDELRSLDNSDVTLRGNISTATNSSYAIYLRNSDSNTYTLIGDISTAGNNSRAMHIRTSDSNTINMTGNISTIGENAHGMRLSTSHSNVISFDGNITTSGENATGVYIRKSDNNVTTLSGNISTTSTGDGGETGLYLQYSDSNTTTLIGNISVTGENATGLQINEGINNTTTLTGNINTTGDVSDAVYFRNGSDNNTINMTGNISTIGVESHGIKLSGSDSNTLNITGDITTTGLDGDSEPILLSNSDSNTITLSGKVQALGRDQAISIDADSDANTFIIESGSYFVGDFENLGTNTVITNQGVMDGIDNTGSIATFNNAQTGATYSGTLPVNYNIIINSPTEYGSTTFSNATGTITFGLDTVNSTSGLGGYYSDILSGIGGSNIVSTIGNSGGQYWVILDSDSDNTFDLNLSYVGNQTITSDISYTQNGAYGFWMKENDSSTISINADITTTGSNAIGFYSESSDSNNITVTGDINTSGADANAVYISTSNYNRSIIITGDISTSGQGASGIYQVSSNENTTVITGDISTTGQGASGIYQEVADANTTSVNGNISTTGQQAPGIFTSNADNNTFVINGNIITAGTDVNSVPILISNSDSNTFNLSGKVHSLGGDQATSIDADSDANTFYIYSGATFLGDLENLGTNTVITNQGVMDGIDNTGSIATFNNAQTGATYSGTLPVNYNIIINSPTSYGQMFVTSAAGSTNFGVSSVPDNLTLGQYTNVMTGVSDGNVGATRSGSLEGNGTSAVGTANWVLTETASDSSAWDLNITGDYVYFGSVATLQNSVNNTASAMRGAFNSITSSMNFANMTTYDCNLFGNNGGCVSVGGRYSGTDNPDTTATAVVAKAGYKFNEHFRYGAFVDQTANSKTGNVDLDMNTPMVGLMGVWNQNPDQLGMQVKLANTYQSTDASITRNDGLSTNYTGDTDINAQSYVAELSWRHLNNQKDTLLQPFVATRYAIIDQDGYSDGFVNYGSVEQKTLTALAGVKAFYQYSHKMTYMGSLGIEHDLDEDADDLSVSVSGVSGLTAASMTDGGEDKTRLLASVGARFFVTPNQRLEGKLMYEQLRYNNADNTTAYVNYTIGF